MSHEPKSAAKGYIYAMLNSSMEGLIKIGASTNHPLERARQLSASTSAPAPFVVAYHKHVSFPFAAEAAIHRQLDLYRVHDSREFFRLPLHEVIAEFDRFGETPVPPEEMALPYSELFWSFSDDGSPRALNEHERELCADLSRKLLTGQAIH